MMRAASISTLMKWRHQFSNFKFFNWQKEKEKKGKRKLFYQTALSFYSSLQGMMLICKHISLLAFWGQMLYDKLIDTGLEIIAGNFPENSMQPTIFLTQNFLYTFHTAHSLFIYQTRYSLFVLSILFFWWWGDVYIFNSLNIPVPQELTAHGVFVSNRHNSYKSISLISKLLHMIMVFYPTVCIWTCHQKCSSRVFIWSFKNVKRFKILPQKQ